FTVHEGHCPPPGITVHCRFNVQHALFNVRFYCASTGFTVYEGKLFTNMIYCSRRGTVHRQESMFTDRFTVHQVLLFNSPGFTVHNPPFFGERLLLHNMEIEGVNEYLLLCDDEEVNMDALDLRPDFRARLGPYFKNDELSPTLLASVI
ncbi:hypothetical protein LINGRAHAP2_LOCUS24525, partial [Linum grandiflorum]